MKAARHLLILAALGLAMLPAGRARATFAPVLHERIAEDAEEDTQLAFGGPGADAPASSGSGPVRPRSKPRAEGPADPAAKADSAPDATFHPDRDTRRPDVLPYEDPFRPSVAPFKRLTAFDAVDASYTLSVADAKLTPVPLQGSAVDGAREDRFSADIPLDLSPDKPSRIPTPGPSTRIVQARLLRAGAALPFIVVHDSADNWFAVSPTKAKARLILELAVPKDAFGFDFGNPSARDLPRVSALPPSVSKAAAEVAAHIGTSRALSPRENVAKLVAYFRSFADSDETPPTARDIYLDLALAQKGVCRHRSFTFLVTAQALGIPTRMVTNEAHAWVEVHNGTGWKRIDLGGAGRGLMETPESIHEPPPDPFAWPQGATRGEDLLQKGANASGAPPPSSSGAPKPGASAEAATDDKNGKGDDKSGKVAAILGSSTGDAGADERAPSVLNLDVGKTTLERGAPIHVRGGVKSEGEPCARLLVAIVLSDSKSGGRAIVLGSLATDENGIFAGDVSVPSSFPVGDYDLTAQTMGDARCGRGASP
ncbi:MAG: transglutaminase domain-containing protein [Polyangiaceae bacterium]|nr:transglutaminase domain-containing protein [Polyangiaceae bacterium]